MARNQGGFSLIELLIVVAIILVLVALSFPTLLKARIQADEASAVASVRTIASAQVTHQILNATYAPNLAALGPGGAGLLPTTLASAPNQHSGYHFTSTGDASTFQAGATPIAPGTSGVRSFCTNTPAVIHYEPTESGCDPTTSPTLN